MISIFISLRDLHTNYILPEPYRSRTSFLPFHIEECFGPPGVDARSQYIVTEVMQGVSDSKFQRGVVVTHWNGIPIDRAVELNAEREAGSNLDARHLRGLGSMTQRWMGMSLPPDEEWVVVRYQTAEANSSSREARFEWQVFKPPPPAGGGGGAVPGVDHIEAADPQVLRIGIDANAGLQRRGRKLLFAPGAVSAQNKMAELGNDAYTAAQSFHNRIVDAATITAGALAPELSGIGSPPPFRRARNTPSARASSPLSGSAAQPDAVAAGSILEGVDLTSNSVMPDVIKQFGKVTSAQGAFGYVRIVTFAIQQVQAFIQEFIRIAALLPQDGLIVDVRGNGGGTIAAGEGLLQTLTRETSSPSDSI